MLKFYAVTKGFPAKFLNLYEISVDTVGAEVWEDSIVNEDFITADQGSAEWYAKKVGGTLFHYRLVDLDYNFSSAVWNERMEKSNG